MSLRVGIKLFFLISSGCGFIGLRAMGPPKSIKHTHKKSKYREKMAGTRGIILPESSVRAKKKVDCLVIDAINAGDVGLLKSIVDFNGNGRDAEERPLLLCAISVKNFDVVRLLLDRKAAVDVGDIFDNTPLHNAVFMGLREIVGLLVARGADILAVNTNGSTPLHLAAARGQAEIAGFLLIHDADINAVDNYGSTPLHRAVEMGEQEAVALLIKQGANINIVDKYGWTPLHFASVRGHREIIALLLTRGAYLTVKNGSGQTVIDVAKNEVIRLYFTYWQSKMTENIMVSKNT